MSSGETKFQQDPTDPMRQVQHALHRVLKSLVFRGEPPTPLNELPILQLRCLHVAAEPEGQKMLEIARRLEIKLPAMSQIVDRLVRRGMVERRADPNDRRVVRLVLTEEARTILSGIHTEREERMMSTIGNLDADSVSRVLKGLTLLAEAAEKVETEERETLPRFTPDDDPLVELMSRRMRHRKPAGEVSPPGFEAVNRIGGD